jgi:putative transposase
MIAPNVGLSVSRQCTLLGIARSSFYYQPRPTSAEELGLLDRLDRIFTEHPVYGSRRLQVALLREGISVGRRRIRRLMRKLGLCAIRPKRNTSKPHPEQEIYPYLLRDKTIDQPNQVWASDITYIPMRRGFLYLVAIIDWSTRRVLSWRLSNTLTAQFCVEALGEALARLLWRCEACGQPPTCGQGGGNARRFRKRLLPQQRRHRHARLEVRAVLLPLYTHVSRLFGPVSP